MRSKFIFGSGLAALLGVGLLFYFPIAAWAQQELMITGQDGNGNSRLLHVTSSGAVNTSLQQCTTNLHRNTSVGTAAITTPSTQLASRRYIVLCNSPQNSGSPLVKCRVDGTPPVMAVANPGDVLGVGDCISYDIAATVEPNCIADTAATNVISYECL